MYADAGKPENNGGGGILTPPHCSALFGYYEMIDALQTIVAPIPQRWQSLLHGTT